MKARTSWREKLADAKDLPRVIKLTGPARKRWGGATMVIAAPVEVDALMKRVPKGRVTTINDLRGALARAHGVEAACPITTGIFAWISAHAAEESVAAGAKRVTPWWRTLKGDGELNPKYPGGVGEQQRRLAAEGHRFIQRGAKVRVADFTAFLFSHA
jgi:alkylated DNA nucleotide flippase Atl1